MAQETKSATGPYRAEAPEHLSNDEIEEIEEHAWLPAPLVYHVVRQEGARELARPMAALWWSGVAAGMSMGLSVYGKALLHVGLPDTDWRPLVENFGYCFGFLVVILSRHQLFTENTITPILPLMTQRTWSCLVSVLRLWTVVAAANLVGALIFALFWVYAPVADTDVLVAMKEIGRQTMENGWWSMLTRSLAAGFLIASLVWIMPSIKGAEFWVIVAVTYLLALGDLIHIVSASIGVLIVLISGDLPLADFLFRFGVPVLVGNVIGGTALFSLIVYAQVRQEIQRGPDG